MLKISQLRSIIRSSNKNFFSTSTATTSSSSSAKICIVGSGPAALYTAQYILKALNSTAGGQTKCTQAQIDIYEKLPVPFGLVRYGVAPDHQDVKNCTNSFAETLRSASVNFFGNVNVGGADLSVRELTQAYNFVVLAYGSHGENYLGIPGEKQSSRNLVSAKDIVSWYNGLPMANADSFRLDLSGRRAVIIGAGNVAVDIARLLVSPVEKLVQTDISTKALEVIKNTNRIEHVTIVARRGLLNAAFTLKELRELTKLAGTQCLIDLEQFKQINYSDELLGRLSRPRRRLTEYMHSMAAAAAHSKPSEAAKRKVIEIKFLRTPVQVLLDSSEHVTGVAFRPSKYEPSPFETKSNTNIDLSSEEALNRLKLIAAADDEAAESLEIVQADLVVRSIGYKNLSIDASVPIDKSLGAVANVRGKVVGVSGLYCTGWIKRGPKGVIVDTTSDAMETAQELCADLARQGFDQSRPGSEQIVGRLRERRVQFVDKRGWARIDAEEVRRGRLVGKPREKIMSISEMLRVAAAHF